MNLRRAVLASVALAACLATAPAAGAQTGGSRTTTTIRSSTTTEASSTTQSSTPETTTTAVPSPIASTQSAFGLNQEERTDPASRRLQLIIIGLLILAVVISIGTLFFWHATRPVIPAMGTDVTVTEERT